jgi:hypothetical protein
MDRVNFVNILALLFSFYWYLPKDAHQLNIVPHLGALHNINQISIELLRNVNIDVPGITVCIPLQPFIEYIRMANMTWEVADAAETEILQTLEIDSTRECSQVSATFVVQLCYHGKLGS